MDVTICSQFASGRALQPPKMDFAQMAKSVLRGFARRLRQQRQQPQNFALVVCKQEMAFPGTKILEVPARWRNVLQNVKRQNQTQTQL
jgi:hypothetical protein